MYNIKERLFRRVRIDCYRILVRRLSIVGRIIGAWKGSEGSLLHFKKGDLPRIPTIASEQEIFVGNILRVI